MTRFATSHASVLASLLHPLLELTRVRIGVAAGAAQVLPVINNGRLGMKLGRLLVTVGTWHRHVPARKHKMCLLVLGQAKRGGFVSLKIVAAVAGIEVRRGGKLFRVTVAVAIGATLELDLEQRVPAFGNVALRALHGRVFTLQRIRA